MRTFRLAAFAAAAAALASCSQPAAQQTAPTPDTPQAPLAIRADDASLQWGPCPDIFPTGCEIAVLHGDPAQPNADVFLRVPGGYQLAPHSHSSAERMILVSGALTVRYQGAAPATLRAGSYAYGPAGLPHDASCAAGEACTLFIAFEGPVDAIAYEGSLD